MNRSRPTCVDVDLMSTDLDATHVAYTRLFGRGSADGAFGFGNGTLRVHGDEAAGHRVRFGVEDLADAKRLTKRRGLDPDEPVDVTERIDRPTPPHADVPGLDHLVFTAPTRDHALALFGATLDLDFRLDRDIGRDARQLFFRAADLVVEVVVGADPEPAPTCRLWGLAWSAPDIAATHDRLTSVGMAISEIRIGQKPGTRLFTVRDRALATRTVVIGPT